MIIADWQAELGGVTVGAGTAYVLTGPITGLGLAPPRTSDAERGNLPGDVGALDIAARRVVTLSVGVNGTNAAHVWGLFETLKAAWTPAADNVAFDLRLPGFANAARRFYGRPRGVDSDLTLLRLGWIDTLCTFDALDPYAYGAPLEVALIDGDTTIANPGSVATDRYTLTVDMDTSPMTFDAGGSEPPLTLEGDTASLIIDGRTRTITDDDGIDRYGYLAPGSGWPVIEPGSHPVSLTGATGALTYRPAYL